MSDSKSIVLTGISMNLENAAADYFRFLQRFELGKTR